MIVLPFILPVLIVIFWQKRPVSCFVSAAVLLLLGLWVLKYISALEMVVALDSPDSFTTLAVSSLPLGLAIRLFAKGVAVIIVLFFVRRYFYKTRARKAFLDETF